MDVIWKHLSDNQASCQRLSLYSQSDPGTGATFAVRCNSLVGVTSEENFLNDAMYLVEGVLPLNETLKVVEMEWSFLSHLEEEDRNTFIRGVASLKKLEEISIRGVMSEDSRMRFRSLLQIPECAKGLKHLAIELDEVHVDDPSEMGLAALLFLRCQHLESFHVRGLMHSANNEGDDFDCSILLSALGKLPALHTIHLSRNQENPKTVNAASLRDVCSLPNLQSLSLMNMGLTDKHCKIFKRTLFASRSLHSLILVDNPGITEKGNKALLRLLEKNRSIYNSTFGTDSETAHRTAQLAHLHLNRCGRSNVKSPTELSPWLNYLSRINETVPEELESDTLFIALQENPEMIVQHCYERDLARVAREQRIEQALSNEMDEPLDHPLYPSLEAEEGKKVLTPKKLPTRKDIVVLNDWGSVFPILTSRDSIDSSLSPAPSLIFRQQDHFRMVHIQPSRSQEHVEGSTTDSLRNQEGNATDIQGPHQNNESKAENAACDEGTQLTQTESGCSASTDPQPTPISNELSVSTTLNPKSIEELTISWDGVVSGLFDRFRDEACWSYASELQQPPSQSVSTRC